MANRGYDVVVDVDNEADLGHTDLQEDNLEFHSSNFSNDPSTKIQSDDSNAAFASSATNPSNLPNSSLLNNNSSSSRGDRNRSAPSKRYLWTISFYAQFFDVDTSIVLHRCRATLIPPIPSRFYDQTALLDALDGNPDLYGPFWIATTVVVILFFTGTISHYLATRGQGHFAYDFKLLSGAAGLIYGYTGLVPAVVWATVRWFGGSSSNDKPQTGSNGFDDNTEDSPRGLNLIDSYCLYGYANLVWILVALVSWSPLTILNYILVAIGYLSSASFLIQNLYRPLHNATLAGARRRSSSDGGSGGGSFSAISPQDNQARQGKKTANAILLAVLLVHAGLAIAIKVLFFANGSPASDVGDAPEPR